MTNVTIEKQNGYYIYYEKNKAMQGYMIEKNKMQEQRSAHEKPDVAMANFRKILKEKQERHKKRKKQAISYGTKVAIALVVFVGAVAARNQLTDFYEQNPLIKEELTADSFMETFGERTSYHGSVCGGIDAGNRTEYQPELCIS